MDWSAIERAVDREASSFNRNNSGFLASTPLSRPATPSRTSFDSRSILGGQTGSYDRFDPRTKENHLQIHTNLPSASSTPREQANDLKASLPPNPPGRYSTMLSDEMSDMRRMVIAQNSRLLALEEQYSKLHTEHSHTMHSLDELGEQYSVLDLNHKKVLNQLDSVSKQQDGQAIKTRKADLRVANLEEIHQFNDKQYVSKEHVKQIVENIVEEVKSAQSSAAALTSKTAELSQIVENVINALFNLGSDNSLQISLLQTMTSEQYKANISALLTDSIQGNITATIQSMYKGTQDQIQNSILLCIKDMREHNEALLRPFIEDQRALAATVNRLGNEVEQVKLFVKTHSTLKPNEQSPEVRDRVSAMEAGVGKMEEALAALQRTCATFTPAIASVDSKYEKHLIVLENTLDIYKTRLETMADNQKASASAVNAVESSLDNCRKDMAFLRNDINPDLFMNHNKLIQDMQLQCNTLLTDFYALKTATENSMNGALQTVNEQVFQFGNEQSKKHNQLANNLDDYKQSLNESIKGMREQVNQCATSVLPMESTISTLQADVKQLVNNYTGISEDVNNRYDRLLKERNENKAYMDSREAGYNKFITDKFNNLEAGQQTWAAQMEKVLHDLQQSSQEDRLRLLEDGMSRLSVTVSDQTNSLRIDNMDINLRKEMDRLKHEQLKVVSDLQERIANSNKQADHKHTELADTVRTNTNKLHSQLDGLTSELNKVTLQLTDTDSTLGKYGSKLVGLEGKLEEQGERLLSRLHDRTTSLEGQMREHREDLLARCNTLDSQLAAHTKGTAEQLDIVRSMLVKQEKALISKMEADLITVREQYTAFVQAEVNTASKAWGLQHKVEMDDVNESIQTILSQHLQFTNILDTLEDSINQSKAELAKNKDLLTLEILGNRDKASSSINKIYKDLNGELEEVKYDLTQMANKYQLLEQYMQSGSIGGGAGSGTGAGADSSMLAMKLDQLERAVHEHHKLFPAHVQEVLTKYLAEQKQTDSHSELVSSSVNRMHIAMSELQDQLKAQESRCCGLIDGVDQKASASVSQLLVKCAALEEGFVSNKEYVPAMDRYCIPCLAITLYSPFCRMQKSFLSFQSQLDSLQEEVVDLGHQTESVAQATESATAAHSAVQDIGKMPIHRPCSFDLTVHLLRRENGTDAGSQHCGAGSSAKPHTICRNSSSRCASISCKICCSRTCFLCR